MNKYLMDRLENETRLDPVIEGLCFVAAELFSDKGTEVFQDFVESNSGEEIVKILNWRDSNEVIEVIENEIEDGCFSGFMIRHARDGFVARVEFVEPQRISLNDEGQASSWMSAGVRSLEWIYADSIGELVHKIILKDQELMKRAIERSKEKSEG